MISRKPELTSYLAAQIEKGVPVKLAAESAGISVGTFYAWLSEGEFDKDGPAEAKVFRRAIFEARRRRVEKSLISIDAAAETDWRAAAWILERVEAESFSATQKVTADVKVEGDPKSDLRALIAGILAKRGEGGVD